MGAMGSSDSVILTYHSLDDSGSPISISPRTFRKQMDLLAASGVPVVPLERVARTPGAVAITFDDGFRNFLEHALPVLTAHRFPAAVFVVTGHCGKNNDWPSQPAGIPRMDLMDWKDLRAIREEGIELGAHSVHHEFLTRLPEDQLSRELSAAKREIEEAAGAVVNSLAYPYGAVNEAVKRLAAQHYSLACTTQLRFCGISDDPLTLPRIDAWYLKSTLLFSNLHKTPARAYLALRRWVRRFR
jgi:peptidoglycan/xylan/chitin deacetylase (PgdA/CDA1 family)